MRDQRTTGLRFWPRLLLPLSLSPLLLRQTPGFAALDALPDAPPLSGGPVAAAAASDVPPAPEEDSGWGIEFGPRAPGLGQEYYDRGAAEVDPSYLQIRGERGLKQNDLDLEAFWASDEEMADIIRRQDDA